MGKPKDGPLRVVVVEDNPDYRRVVEDFLKRADGEPFAVRSAGSLAEGLALLGEADVLLLDLHLPDSAGLDTVKRALARAPGLPIVVLTGLDDTEAAREAIRLGAQDYLMKGLFDAGTLRRALRYAPERKGALEALHQHDQRFKELAEGIREVFWLAEPGFRGVLYLSPAFEEVWRLPRRKAYDDPEAFFAAIAPPDRDRVRAALAGGEPGVEEFRVDRASGGSRWVRSRTFTLPAADGPPRLAGIVEDVTEHRDLRQRFEQLRRMEALSRLAGGVAHDFNNLMTSILGYSEILQGTLEGGDGRMKDLEEIKTAARKAAAITRQLLAVGRRQISEPSPMDLGAVARECSGTLRRLLGEHIALRLEPGEEPARALVDPGQIEQILLTLAMHARDLMPKGGEFRIAVERAMLAPPEAGRLGDLPPGAYVRMTFEDDGQGLDPEACARLFEPFYYVKKADGSTGLGLAVVHGIAEQMGGRIFAESRPGEGTRFTLYLPEAGSLRAARPKPSRAAPESPVVLIAEDEPALRRLAERVLSKSGCRVLCAADGAEAIRICSERRAPIDLLLADVVMPGMNGFQLAEEVGSRHPETKVLFMTGYSGEAIPARGEHSPEFQIIAKPFSPAELAERVASLLGPAGP